MKKDATQTKISSSKTRNIVSLGILSLVCIMPTQLQAAEQGLCKTQPLSIFNKNIFSSDGKTHLQSDSVEFNEKNISYFKGNVVIQQNNKRIEAEHAEYRKKTEEVKAKGNVRFISSSMQVKSESADFNLKTDQAILKNANYQGIGSRAHGKAASIEIKNKDVTILKDATFTTCDLNNTDWILNASTLKFDNKEHQGYANNVVVRFKGVPFFYFPYLRFPLGDQRLSGFLFPYIGRSSTNGSELKLPYYWNIHPQVDATITPWYMAKRGTLLHSEFRYLTENNNGTLTAEYLNNDKIFKDSRERWQWIHKSQPSLGWQAKAEYNYVADTQHLTDFGDDLNSSSKTYLVRSGEIAYSQPNWLLNIKAEAHQILTGTEPYKRLPQITLNSRYAVKNNAINYKLQAEAVRFDHINKGIIALENNVVGDRLHIKPSISYPLRSAAGFFEPKLSVQHTTYNLQQTTGETQLSRTVPTFSLNSGLFFERETQISDTGYIQTLEPQLFYVYVPFEDQSKIPLFDTSIYAFNVNQFFTDYRFNGIDRIGDDNRLTAALATRFISQENGQEVFLARIGQIYYLKDRRVQLPPTTSSTRSNIIAEIKTKAYNWSLSSQVEWDPDQKEKESSSDQLSYKYKTFNVSYAQRFKRNSLETRETKLNWALNSSWQFNASELYDVHLDHVIESRLGINYESCCWGLKFTASERFLTNTTTDKGFFITLTLKGLGGVEYKRRYTSDE